MNRKPLCLYHVADLDGHCSGAIVHYALEGEVELMPINYGYPIPEDEVFRGRDVYIVDFSLRPWGEMERIHKLVTGNGYKFVYIDHHQREVLNCKEYEKREGIKVLGLRDADEPGKAACYLTWKYIFNEGMPAFIELLSRWDVWDHDLEVRQFQYGMRLEDTNPIGEEAIAFWYDLFDCIDNEQIIEERCVLGSAILKYQQQQWDIQARSKSFRMIWKGYQCLFANHPPVGSDFFKSVLTDEDDIMVQFIYDPKKRMWKFSLRTVKDDIDVATIAAEYDGGGHSKAAGFHIHDLRLEWEEVS